MRLWSPAALMLAVFPATAWASVPQSPPAGASIGPVPIEFILFGLVLLGVALFHRHTLGIALGGAIVISIYKIFAAPFAGGPGIAGFGIHLEHEWVIMTNLLLLLVGFGLLARQFEDSGIPDVLPHYLPDDWTGSFALLALIFVISGFLDNIAGALIGGAIAHTVYRRKVHIGYLAAIVAASNAGGAGSVLGDTTTTMMWIAGVRPIEVMEAYVGSIVALVVFGIPASLAQQKYSPIQKDSPPDAKVDWGRVGVVGAILLTALIVNVVINTHFTTISDTFPFLGAAVWVALLITALIRRPEWGLVPGSIKSSIFLLSLVLCASMMPVERLPDASWQTVFGLGFVSSIFDNIPLTALALKQGGYDWGFLAYAAGFGGSLTWFGSSAGVALSAMYPETRSVVKWVKEGWFVIVAYVVGFFALLAILHYHPGSRLRESHPEAPTPIGLEIPTTSK